MLHTHCYTEKICCITNSNYTNKISKIMNGERMRSGRAIN